MKFFKNQRIWWLAAGLVAASFVVIKKKSTSKDKEILFIEPNTNQNLIHG